MRTEKHKHNTEEVAAIMRLLAPHAILLSLLVHIQFFIPTITIIGYDVFLFLKNRQLSV